MKKIRMFLSLLLVVALCSCMFGCSQNEGAQKPDQKTEEQQILEQRRDAVEKHMRDMLTVLWRPKENINHTITGTSGQMKIVAGRLYRGVPYAYACGTKESFLEYAGEPDDNGVYTISGLPGVALDGGIAYARIGSDCSSAITTAWSTVSTSLTGTRSFTMFQDYGVIPVGDYKFDVTIDQKKNLITDTASVINANGISVMYEAYAKLQKGDAVFYVVKSDNHSRMIVDTNVVYADDGTIDGKKSTVTVLQQTRINFQKEITVEDPRVNETVYIIGGVDDVYSFDELATEGYLPVTIKELVDPSPVDALVVTDSETVFNKDTLFAGTISSNMFIDCVTVTVTDSQGKTVQKATARVTRQSNKEFEMKKLQRDGLDNVSAVLGHFDPATLPQGTYRCTTVCRLTTGQEFTVRTYDFTV